jgi:hypothetical protein
VTRLPFPLAIPAELTAYILDFRWDLDRLHRLELPSTRMPIEDLAHHLDLPFWAYDGRPFQLTPHQVAEDPVRYRAQYERTLAANLRHPLDVVRRPDGRLTILDGVHRLLLVELEGRTTVAVRVLSWGELDRIAVTSGE